MDTTKLKGAFGDYANAPENSENRFPHRWLHCRLCLERRVRCLPSHSDAGPPGRGCRTALCPTTTSTLQKALADIQEFPQALRKPSLVWMFPIVEPWKICYCRNSHCSVIGDQCSEEYRKQAVTLHQLILCYRFSTSQSIHAPFRQSAGPI